MALEAEAWLSLIVAALTLAGVAFGRLPALRLSRAGVAFVGAAALVLLGVIDVHLLWELIDGETLVLLLALMLVNAAATLAAALRALARRVAMRARSPLGLLTLLAFASGAMSALFLNDTVALMLTPLVVTVTRALKCQPLPYLLALALSANVGSVATITGNPQNLVVGLKSGVTYLAFSVALAPVALMGLVVTVAVVALSFPQEFRGARFAPLELPPVRVFKPLLAKVAVVGALMVAGFFAGLPIVAVALVAAAALLISRRVTSDKLFARVDWGLLVLFGGLFVVVGALGETGVSLWLFAGLGPLMEAGLPAFSLMVLVLSNLLSNVPAVLLLAPFIPELAEPELAWLALAMASTLAGNLTLVGSIANLIVAEGARREGVRIGFWAYLRVGLPVTFLTTLVGVAWLSLYARWS